MVGLRRPEERSLRRRRPTPGAVRLGRPISIGGKAFGRWSACADRKSVLCVGGGRRLARRAWKADFNRREGLRPMVGLRRPEERSLRRRRPTPGAVRLGRPISIGVKAFGRWSACADREDRFCVGGGRRPARCAWKADFNRREGLRPTVGLRRPEERSLRRRRPTPGAVRLGRPISIGGKAFGRWSACADRENPFASAKADARRASA
jgi:hypothetical protein